MSQDIAYADDALILGLSVRAIGVVVTLIKEAGISSGLVINKSKTKMQEYKQKYNKFRAQSENGQTI